MKRFVTSFLQIAVFNICWAQNSTVISENLATKGSERWNLDKYVWSHAHIKPSKPAKALLDFEAIDNWIGLSDRPNATSISPDGKFIAYTIDRSGNIDSLVIQSTTDTWRLAFSDAEPGFFSADSKCYVFRKNGELCFLNPGNSITRCEKEILDIKVPVADQLTSKHVWVAWKRKNNEVILCNLLTGMENRFVDVADFNFDDEGTWLAIKFNDKNELLLYNITSQKESRFQYVETYMFHNNGKYMLLKTEQKVGSDTIVALKYVNLNYNNDTLNNTTQTIWSSANNSLLLDSYSMDRSGQQVVFLINKVDTSKKTQNDNSKQPESSIWYWKVGMDKALMKLNNHLVGSNSQLKITGPASITDNGKFIIYYVESDIDTQIADKGFVQMELWSHKDEIIQSSQALLKEPLIYAAAFDLDLNNSVQLENVSQKLASHISGDYAVVTKLSTSDKFWEENNKNDSNWIISLKDGRRKYIPATGKGSNSVFRFSPEGNYLVFFNGNEGGHYYSYNVINGKLTNISKNIPGKLAYKSSFLRTNNQLPAMIVPSQLIGWLGGEKVLVSDLYDIWQLDLEGKELPINITNRYGHLNNTLLQIIGYSSTMKIYSRGDTLILKAFNRKTKFNGYCRKILGTNGDPELLYMGACFMDRLDQMANGINNGMNPIKATNVNVWLVQRQTATEAPNYFITKDFRSYERITNFQPQKNYNWLSAELHSFKELDGHISQGILYKPENFDSSQKYPVIIAFYGTVTDQLYQFPIPTYINRPNILDRPAWMVSHGYLVFMPDVYFINGNWGLSIMNTIEGAARYLKSLAYVDNQHLGAVGHSNSGRFGYYLFSHSSSFAAMSMGAGVTNIISSALKLWGRNTDGGESTLEWAEKNAYGSGGLDNLWNNKKKWLDHSAVLNADKVTCPLLMFHNRRDGAFTAGSALEMYIALRRLGKSVWWLQYDDGYHTVAGDNARDLTIRYTQFFDHYLKGAPAPRWMTSGIPFKLKGIESRYELDPTGICGNTCTFCNIRLRQKR
ncbi:S9 family peptidase [Longitalea arenae]|uniref:S9 family peptidase n=1 Tax=Longitalea arenae TaxID=2812558 RepID=UPI0019687D6E|nr:prolyl oligopeptidase family serine peptidase [Longitalea arenae]